MNTPQWERAKEIFDTVLDLPLEERPGYLLQTCSEDHALRQEVEGLLAADEAAGSFMNDGWLAPFSPFAPTPEFQLAPGDIVSGRFRIVRPLGDGGMGRVYEAYDSALGVQVALKTLRPEISSSPEVLLRFRQEVRIAHRITHPNVCRTYHLDHELRKIGADENSSVDLTFLTMEFLDGETLRERLKRCGRLPLAQAHTIARQMAEAMEAAHRTGIVHRDIKPGNVMICAATHSETEDRIVITDFGLAKFDAGAFNDHSSISQPGQAMGTLAYMSPEQLQAADVGSAADIYAFGLVLYEMVTGVKAFPDSNTITAAYRRVTAPPPSPREMVPDLPSAWEKAILGCLQIEPAARFQHATEVVNLLEGTSRHASWWPPSRLTHIVPHPKTRWRRIAFALAILSAMALFAFGLRYFTTRESSTVAPGALVYLAPVKNETGEKQLDNVTELVQAGLQQSAHINLLDAGRVGDTLQHMMRQPNAAIDEATAREIAMRNGAARVVFATIRGSGGDYSLDIDLQKTDNSPARYREHWLHSFTWQVEASKKTDVIPEPLLAQMRNTSDWIRHGVGESANDIARLNAPPEDVTTNSWQALTDFNTAEAQYRASQKSAAIDSLQNAVQHDPNFAIAYALLGDILYTQGRTAEGSQVYRRALEIADQSRLSVRERARLKGVIGQDTHDFQASAEAYRELTAFYPNDSLAWLRLAHPLIELDRPQEAVQALLAAHRLNPKSASVVNQLVRSYQLVGDNDSAAVWLTTLKDSYANDEYLYTLGPYQFVKGDFTGAQATLQSLATSKNPAYRYTGTLLLGDFFAEQGDDAKALTAVASGLTPSSEGRLQRLEHAELAAHLHDYDGCLADLQQSLASHKDAENLMDVAGILGRAFVGAPSGERTALLAHLRLLYETQPPQAPGLIGDLSRDIVHGELLLAEGKTEAAITEFRKASALDAPIAPREYLARALAASATQHPASPHAREEAREAEMLYAETADRPVSIWWFAQGYPPGSHVSAVSALARLRTVFPALSPAKPGSPSSRNLNPA